MARGGVTRLLLVPAILELILNEPAVSTVIPGMRKPAHVSRNLAVSDGRPLPTAVVAALRHHRWDRTTVIE